MNRYEHKWYTPIVIRIWPESEPEFVYYGPYFDPRKLPVPESVNVLALPYEKIMPIAKAWYLQSMSILTCTEIVR
jgi:hypothetical protein